MTDQTLVTIADIARTAGVGTATVDRVLNGRAGVNAETIKKVKQTVAAMGEPVVSRGRPRKQRNFRFAYVLPNNHTRFFDLIERQIAQAAGEFRHQAITEVTYCFNADDPDEFARQLGQIEDCDGIALLAPDLPAIKRAINEKVRSGVRVVTLLSDVAGSMREMYVGPDNRAAGRTAALLLARMSKTPARNKLLLLSHATRLSSEIDRRIGFAQVIEESFPNLQIVRSPDLPINDVDAYQVVKKLLKTDIDPAQLAGAYVCGGSGASGAVDAFKELNLSGTLGLVVHNLTDTHQDLLSAGHLSYVLDQDNYYCISTAAKVLRGLCENVRGAVQVSKPRIDILTVENIN